MSSKSKDVDQPRCSKMIIEGVQKISPAKFFASNRSIAGFGNPAKALYTSVRELVENALDATESMNVLPYIRIRLKRLDEEELQKIVGIPIHLTKKLEELSQTKQKNKEKEKNDNEIFELVVSDNGIGMKFKEIPVLMGQVLTSTKYQLIQKRGRFGLGGKMVFIYSMQETNMPVEIWSARKEDIFVSHYILKIDLERNEPIIILSEKINKKKFRDPWGKEFSHGTIIKVYVLGDWQRSRKFIMEYFKRMAIITPYATFIFEDPNGGSHVFERVVEEMPKPPKPTKYHMQGIDSQVLLELLKRTKKKNILSFLITEFQRVGKKTALSFLELIGISPNTPISKIRNNDKLIATIVEAARKFNFMSPDSSCLSPIGAELLKKGISKVLNPEFVSVISRKPFAYNGHPMIVEIGVAYGGNIAPGIQLYRYANRVPLLYKTKSDVSWKVIEEIDWSIYKIKRDETPLAIFISIVSTKIPFSETSKDFIDDVDILHREIKLGIQEALRDIRSYIIKKERIIRKTKRRELYSRYASKLVRSLVSIARTNHVLKDSPEITETNLFAALMDLIDRKMTEETIGMPKESPKVKKEKLNKSGDLIAESN